MSEQAHRNELESQVAEKLSWIYESAEKIGGPGATPETVFVAPSKDDRERGAAAQSWTEDQETELYALGEKLGYASEFNVPTGLIGGVRLVEAGKTWKVMAELEALKADEQDVEQIVLAGSPFVALGDDEKAFAVQEGHDHLTGAESQYDVALILARGLVAEADERTLPYGYAVAEGNELIAQPSDQLKHLGKTAAGQSVEVIRVDRQVNEDGSYSFQPSQLRLLGILSEILTARGDSTSGAGLLGSNAYASRRFEVLRAALRDGRQYEVGMYGRATLAAVKNEPMLPGARITHLPGDIRLSYDSLKALESELKSI